MVTNGIQEQAVQTATKSAMLVDKLNITRATLFDMGLFAGIGFLVGFLMRRFSSFLIAFVIFGVLLFAAQEMGVVSLQVNINQLLHLVGIDFSVPMTYDTVFSLLTDWLRSNVVIAIAGVIGFLLGLQVG